MKALLVIDVPDGIDIGRYRANGLVRQIIFDSEEETMYSTPIEFHFCSLKPLPKKMNPFVFHRFGVYVEDNYARGWNTCLEELEK